MYKITSKNNIKPVEVFTSVFENTADGTRGWTVTEFYKSAIAYRESHECPTRKEQRSYVICNPSDGLGCELFNLIGYHFTFDDCYDSIEQAVIRDEWLNIERISRWTVEEEYIKIPANFQVDLICRTEAFDYDVVESDILLCEYAD